MTDKAKTTNYLIFYSRTGKEWEQVGQLDAPGQTAALRSYTSGMTETDGFWSAVPARSWQPVRVEPQTVITHKLVAVTPKPQPVAAPRDPEPATAPAA